MRVVTALIGVDYTGGHGVTVIIPADAILQIVSGPRLDNTRMVSDGKADHSQLFVKDILDRSLSEGLRISRRPFLTGGLLGPLTPSG
jgi:hypothetical protein